MNDDQKPQTSVDLPGDDRTVTSSHVPSNEYLIVEPDAEDPSKNCWHLPEQQPNLATIALDSYRPRSPGGIKTLVCKNGARPSNLEIPTGLRESIETIVLENGHVEHLDTLAFPNLWEIVCKNDVVVYPATNLDRAGCDLTDRFEMEEIIYRQRPEIHRQIRPQLPRWMQAFLVDGNENIELSIRISLDFRTREEECAAIHYYWDGNQLQQVQRPPWFTPVCILYSWRAGHSYWALQSLKVVDLMFEEESNSGHPE
ncbi:uncharacterized protein Z520_07010 [Fonsecaea multimorphosa CBS 102226]|uniref:Uncharacterized protein n=1 Tax=Fonsecaea multimorphosa CBS 102226 TaxID=1442371 RepID=A0A0D2JVR4_9EURO|nr:uncharacterized protein Z520_07010 [Fonsecaea multimorphosa CBS 102226]KIX97557.1 hypothetical protein Z520_07010 [Fonsecaea multimorphosa CBS 102226]OAL23514.1 hypothetical protein AYO22_06564 [Fonsecaea multimorphosa]